MHRCLVLLAAVSLLSSGCGVAQPAQVADTQGAPTHGGSVRTPISIDPYDFDITYNGRATGNGHQMRLAYNNLLGFKSGPDVPYNEAILMPELAERWSVSPDAKSFTFSVRKGVKWANLPPLNGRELTAQDVKWSYEYATRTGEFREKNLPKAYYDYFFEEIDKIESPDASTVVVRFAEPSIPFLNYSAADHNPILPKEIYQQDGHLKNQIAGTGPFQLDQAASQKGSRWVWKKNPSYWKPDKPYLDELTVLVLPDESTIAAAFQTKQLDLIHAVGFAWAQELRKVAPNAVFYEYETAFPQDFFFRLDKPWVNDVRIRQAMALAVNRDELMRTFQGGRGSWMMPGIFSGYFTQEEVKRYVRHDLDEVKKLLAQAGYNREPIEFTYGTPATDFTVSRLQLLQSQFKKAGINVVLKPVEQAAFSLNMKSAGFTLMLLPGDAKWDVNTALTKFVPSSKSNFQGANDAKLAELVAAQRSEVDPAKRREVVRQAAMRIVDLGYGVGMYSVVNYHVWQPPVKGYTPNWNVYGWPLEDAWLEK